MRAATTSARSSRATAPRRSKMRQGSGLPSGMRALRDERFDEAQGLAVAPVPFTEHPVAHLAFRVDQERDRKAARVPVARRILLRTEQHRQVDLLALHEGLDALGPLAVVDGEHLEWLPLHLRA